jgi:hypothetical protein
VVRAALKANADRFAANTLTIIKQIQASGVTTLNGIAAALAARSVAYGHLFDCDLNQ